MTSQFILLNFIQVTEFYFLKKYLISSRLGFLIFAMYSANDFDYQYQKEDGVLKKKKKSDAASPLNQDEQYCFHASSKVLQVFAL